MNLPAEGGSNEFKQHAFKYSQGFPYHDQANGIGLQPQL